MKSLDRFVDQVRERIEGAGVEEAAAGLNHCIVVAGMAGAALMAEQQVGITFFGEIECMVVCATALFPAPFQCLRAGRAEQEGFRCQRFLHAPVI